MKKLCFALALALFAIAAIGQDASRETPKNAVVGAAQGTTGGDLLFGDIQAKGGSLEGKSAPLSAGIATMLGAYRKGAETKPDFESVASAVLREYYVRYPDSRSAPQATQLCEETQLKMQMVQIAQNQRIIELLDELVKKKAGN